MEVGIEDNKRRVISKIVKTANSNNFKMEVKDCVQNKKEENQNKLVLHKNNNSKQQGSGIEWKKSKKIVMRMSLGKK